MTFISNSWGTGGLLSSARQRNYFWRISGLYNSQKVAVRFRAVRVIDHMRKQISLLVVVMAGAALLTGCARTERKLGRGMSNTMEIVRMGELRRTMEQTTLWEGPDTGYTMGFVRGLNRSLARTGIGIYEVLTFPLPPYDPVATDYLAPGPVYPDNYRPKVLEDSMYATDTNLGFSGGDVAPIIPGSRFRIFDTH